MKLLSELKLTERRMKILKSMGLFTLEDLFRHYPLRYEELISTPCSLWQPQDHVAFEGTVLRPACVYKMKGNQSRTVFMVQAFGQELEITLFNRPWTSGIQSGKTLTITGIYQGKNKVAASGFSAKPLEKEQSLKPVYAIPKSLKPSEMKQIMDLAFQSIDDIEEIVPERYRTKYRLLERKQAFRQIHRPKNRKELHAAVRTLKYEEFLVFQCVLQASKVQILKRPPAVYDEGLLLKKTAELPYELTSDQKRTLDEILADLKDSKQMYRMVQGDVGCGKTAVAALALYAMQLSGRQGALLAPTEILARQHVKTLQSLNIEARLLCSGMPASEQKEVRAGLESGAIQTVVGTHSLFQESVSFHDLGLVIADEQHRFGVRQRKALIEKGAAVDFLMMSATPIPRTYAHFLFGDIDLSEIRTRPPGRQPVKTRFFSGSTMKPFLKDILNGLKEKRQLYVVCPAIEENPDLEMKSAMQVFEGMSRVFSGHYSVGLLHGKMKPDEKERIMQRFKEGEIDILVCTTVIEVGVDVANANMMVIYDAHRFGLSALHQLRGRTARSSVQGECWLLSPSKDPDAKARLKELERLNDGFDIAEFDLRSRGPGDLLGTRQSGLPAFVLGDYEKDPAMMEACVIDAKEILYANKDEKILSFVQEASAQAAYID